MRIRTREENFWAKIAQDPAADKDMKPLTTEEYMMDQAAKVIAEGGGGSSLPPYTSADKGKGLFLAEDAEHPVSKEIVPEQTHTIIDLTSVFGTGVGFQLQNVDADFLNNAALGTQINVAYNAENWTLTKELNQYLNVPMWEEGDRSIVSFSDEWYVAFYSGRGYGEVGDTATVSATASVPSVEPKWEKGLSPIKILGRASGSGTGEWDQNQNCIIDIPSIYAADEVALMDIDVTINGNNYHVEYLPASGTPVELDNPPLGIADIKIYIVMDTSAALRVDLLADTPSAPFINVSAAFTAYTYNDLLWALLF